MARRDTAPRRYADAAFEIGLRDGTVEVWRRELDAAAATAADVSLMGALANPAMPVEQRIDAAERVFADLSQPVRNLVLLLVRRHRIEQLPRVGRAQGAARDPEVDRQHGQGEQLSGERLGGRDPDLGPHQGLNDAIRLPDHGRARRVADGQGRHAAPLHRPKRGQGVGGLPRLRDGDQQRVARQQGRGTAELGGVVDAHRDPGEPLDQIAADEPRVPRRSARHDLHVLQLAHGRGGEAEIGEHDVAAPRREPSGDRLREDARLLVDLLRHEMAMALLLNDEALPIHPVTRPVREHAVDVGDADPGGLHDADVAVLQVGHLGGVLLDGEHVRGDQVLVRAIADHQRARAPRGQDQVGLARRDEGQGVAALEPPQRGPERRLQPHPLRHVVGDELRDHLGIGGRGEDAALGLELLADLEIVLDDAVVDHRDGLRRVGVRVGVGHRRGAVSGPAGVADADVRLHRLPQDLALEIGDLADLPAQLQNAVQRRGQAGRIVSPILEPFQAVDDHDLREIAPDIADDPTHFDTSITVRTDRSDAMGAAMTRSIETRLSGARRAPGAPAGGVLPGA